MYIMCIKSAFPILYCRIWRWTFGTSKLFTVGNICLHFNHIYIVDDQWLPLVLHKLNIFVWKMIKNGIEKKARGQKLVSWLETNIYGNFIVDSSSLRTIL